MHSKRLASGHKTTWQKRTGALTSVPRGNDPRDMNRSMFMITINTNMCEDDNYKADGLAEKLAGVVDSMGYDGPSCELWGSFFKVNTGRGRKWLDKKQTKPNPKYNPNYNAFYAQDDKQGMEHWCSFLECMKIESAGVEWAPGTKRGKNQYLHTHLFVKVAHRTRLLINTDSVADYIKTKMNLDHKPYVHVDVVRDTTNKIIAYTLKNAWNKDLDREIAQKAHDFFADIC